MKRVCIKSGIFRSLVLALLVCFALINPACGVNMNTSLLIQQTPVNGGKVTPEVGVHQIVFDSEVKIRAIASPGYQFVYWLGDIVDPISSSTVVVVDGPKIVIAVFERVSHEFVITEEGPQGGAGGTMLIPNRQEIRSGGIRPVAGKRPHKPNIPPFSDPFPVPGEGEDDPFPVPEQIPEPTTILLMAFGTLFMTRAGKRKKMLR